VVAPNPIVNIPRNYAEVTNNVAPAGDFNLDAGVYGLTAHATAWGTLQLQRMINDPTLGAFYIPMAAAMAADGFVEFHLPAGQYHLAMAGTTGAVARLERIGPWAGR
jgi:hypothetical protein